MVRYRQMLMAEWLPGESSAAAAAAFAKPSTRRRGAVLATMLLLALIFFGNIESARASSLVPQTQLDGNCFPKFAVAVPVFGPAGSIPRVDAVTHRKLTVTMKEVDQAALPQGFYAPCGVTLGRTRVWAYETSDTATKQILGPASWPAVTIVTQRSIPTVVEYVNQLPSFNPTDPTGPGLVEGILSVDQTLHWADPLQTGCGMKTIDCSQASGGAWVADKPVVLAEPKVVACGQVMPAAGQIRPASYTMAAAAGSTSPCCQQYIGPVPATVHLHGAQIPAAFDGNPDSWFTPDGQTGPDYHTIGSPDRARRSMSIRIPRRVGLFGFTTMRWGSPESMCTLAWPVSTSSTTRP